MRLTDWQQGSALAAADPAWLEAHHPLAASLPVPQPEPAAGGGLEVGQVAVLQLINAYRFLGVMIAKLDPLARHPVPEVPELTLAHYQLGAADLDRVFDTGSLAGPLRAPLGDILQRLQMAYCGHIGAEYMHITDVARKRWIQQRLEAAPGDYGLNVAERVRLLDRLTDAETLEKFIHTRYVGQKRFSLEGGESLIPLLDRIVERAAHHGAQEIVLGMAHRGRINVLVNLLGRSLTGLFDAPAQGPGRPLSGDVKYHQGFSADLQTPHGRVHVALAFNPSHLEIVHPVVRGSVRARQDRRGDEAGREVVPVILHGDAALSGQGVVMESLNMSQARGFRNQGAIHIVINNQIGFTTSDTRDARSSLYCTDVAKMVEAPVFHVNADDPEAVDFVTRLAVDYRYAFQRNAFIDLVCFRRHGHNEQDEPLVTQPFMYRQVHLHPGTRARYADSLQLAGLIPAGDAEARVNAARERLEGDTPMNPAVLPEDGAFKDAHAVNWAKFIQPAINTQVDTRVPLTRLKTLGEALTRVPEGFALHPRVQQVVEARSRMMTGEQALDWGMGETLAYASLLAEGDHVRLCGQDSGRGTFFHRHAVWHDQNRRHKDEGYHLPLRTLGAGQGRFVVIDSLLSEEAVLAFEYGYATASPDTLVLWEAQFGDFANGAQVVIDQFIAGGEAKWGRMCGLVLLLPHGYEGQGPEHSSARIERYLQLCAQHNWQVAQPSLPAQLFHLLRRQMRQGTRKPLVVFTPKSLLRHPLAVSPLTALAEGHFHGALDDPRPHLDPHAVKRIVVTSGKLYYELAQRVPDGVALLRVEQFYPFPEAELTACLARYPAVSQLVWAQEEPVNQGPWYAIWHRLNRCAPRKLRFAYAGRPDAAAPASGYPAQHKAQLDALIADALGLP
jgi:2-oxoglutarate dehydrogenase E1 component